MQVFDDFRFEKLCDEAYAEGGRIKVTVHRKIVAQDYEVGP